MALRCTDDRLMQSCGAYVQIPVYQELCIASWEAHCLSVLQGLGLIGWEGSAPTPSTPPPGVTGKSVCSQESRWAGLHRGGAILCYQTPKNHIAIILMDIANSMADYLLVAMSYHDIFIWLTTHCFIPHFTHQQSDMPKKGKHCYVLYALITLAAVLCSEPSGKCSNYCQR